MVGCNLRGQAQPGGGPSGHVVRLSTPCGPVQRRARRAGRVSARVATPRIPGADLAVINNVHGPSSVVRPAIGVSWSRLVLSSRPLATTCGHARAGAATRLTADSVLELAVRRLRGDPAAMRSPQRYGLKVASSHWARAGASRAGPARSTARSSRLGRGGLRKDHAISVRPSGASRTDAGGTFVLDGRRYQVP